MKHWVFIIHSGWGHLVLFVYHTRGDKWSEPETSMWQFLSIVAAQAEEIRMIHGSQLEGYLAYETFRVPDISSIAFNLLIPTSCSTPASCSSYSAFICMNVGILYCFTFIACGWPLPLSSWNVRRCSVTSLQLSLKEMCSQLLAWSYSSQLL